MKPLQITDENLPAVMRALSVLSVDNQIAVVKAMVRENYRLIHAPALQPWLNQHASTITKLYQKGNPHGR